MSAMDEKKEHPSDLHIEDISLKSESATDIDPDLDLLSSIEETAASKSAWLISLTVSLGGLLFGYDTGYISSVLVSIGTSLGRALTSNEQELVTSLTSGGALLGAIFAGLIADSHGRRAPIWAACAVFVAGTVLQTAAYSIAQFAVGRLVVGLGVGSAAMIVPLYIGEIAPARYRGRMIAFNNISVTFGQLVASAIGAGLARVEGEGWRGTVGIGALPALMLAGMLFWCPESPRQLVARGRKAEAEGVLARIYPAATAGQRAAKVGAIEASMREAKGSAGGESLGKSFGRIFNTPATGRAVLVACVIMAVSQLGGFNTLMYYSATLFAIVGFDDATAVAITVSATNFVFSILNLVLVDRFGRRILLIVSVLGMSVCLLVTSVAFHFTPIERSTLTVQSSSVDWPGILVLVAIILYVGFYSSGVATIAWIGTELIPLEVRALGTMLNTVTCWSTNIIVASTFLSMMKGISPSGAFGFYCGICMVGWIFILFCYPDVKGMSLETIREVFKHGFGVRYSRQWQKNHTRLPDVGAIHC